MTGTVASLISTDGTITSNTEPSCTYAFTRDQFHGDWDAMVEDFGDGVPIAVSFQRVPSTFDARVVRRLLP